MGSDVETGAVFWEFFKSGDAIWMQEDLGFKFLGSSNYQTHAYLPDFLGKIDPKLLQNSVKSLRLRKKSPKMF